MARCEGPGHGTALTCCNAVTASRAVQGGGGARCRVGGRAESVQLVGQRRSVAIVLRNLGRRGRRVLWLLELKKELFLMLTFTIFFVF